MRASSILALFQRHKDDISLEENLQTTSSLFNSEISINVLFQNTYNQRNKTVVYGYSSNEKNILSFI